MNKKNLAFVTGLSLLLGLVSLVGFKNTSVLPAKAEVIESKITVDPNNCWGGGTESYKVAANIFDDNSHSDWTDLVTITAPSTYVELPFKIEFEASFIRLYRYNVDFSKENWEVDPTGEHYSDYGWSVSPVLNIVHDVEFENSNNLSVINIILENDTYGLNSVPNMVHQIYLPDESTWSSEEVYLTTVKENSLHHTEYSAEVELKENDLIKLERYFDGVTESKITLDESVSSTDVEYWESGSNKGLECKSEGIYTLRLDYKDQTVEISKAPIPAPVPTPESKTYIYVAIIIASVTGVALAVGLVLILRKHKKNKIK
jgi:hypothetical protein